MCRFFKWYCPDICCVWRMKGRPGLGMENTKGNEVFPPWGLSGGSSRGWCTGVSPAEQSRGQSYSILPRGSRSGVRAAPGAGADRRRDPGPSEERKGLQWWSVLGAGLLRTSYQLWTQHGSRCFSYLPKSTFTLSCMSDLNRVFTLLWHVKMPLDFVAILFPMVFHLWGDTGRVREASELQAPSPHSAHTFRLAFDMWVVITWWLHLSHSLC